MRAARDGCDIPSLSAVVRCLGCTVGCTQKPTHCPVLPKLSVYLGRCSAPVARCPEPVAPLATVEGYSWRRGTCHSGAVYGADPLRSLPKPQQRRIHRAVILGRPVPHHQAAVAAGHARHLRWVSVVGGIIAMIGAAMLVANAFLHATWSSWLTPAVLLVGGAIFLFFGFNARRAARAYHHPRG